MPRNGRIALVGKRQEAWEIRTREREVRELAWQLRREWWEQHLVPAVDGVGDVPCPAGLRGDD